MGGSSSDPDKLVAKADKLTKLSLTRWSADWKSATGLYEQAANSYTVAKDYEKAKEAFEKASKGQEMISSLSPLLLLVCSILCLSFVLLFPVNFTYDIICYQLRPWDAAKHMESAAAHAKELGKWSEVADFYRRASELYVEGGRSQPASDALAKGARYMDAANLLLRLGLAADKRNAMNSQFKAYLSAIIVYLYADDFKEAEKCYNDCSQIDAF